MSTTESPQMQFTAFSNVIVHSGEEQAIIKAGQEILGLLECVFFCCASVANELFQAFR